MHINTLHRSQTQLQKQVFSSVIRLECIELSALCHELIIAQMKYRKWWKRNHGTLVLHCFCFRFFVYRSITL